MYSDSVSVRTPWRAKVCAIQYIYEYTKNPIVDAVHKSDKLIASKLCNLSYVSEIWDHRAPAVRGPGGLIEVRGGWSVVLRYGSWKLPTVSVSVSV